MSLADWSEQRQRWPNFTRQEMQCRCGCGRADMDAGFMDWLQNLRSALGQPMVISSGYRCETYDRRIGGAGRHPTGRAADVEIGRQAARALEQLAIANGVKGKGARQHGTRPRFLHLDLIEGREAFWTYP